MPVSVTLQAVGLNVQPNQLSLPPGSLVSASNVIIKRDGVIEPRRGYPLYGTALGSSSDRAKQLMTYKQRILRHFSNQLEYDTLQLNSLGESIFLPFCGTYLEPQVGRRIRFIEANGNFYFTTSDGIKKIAAKTAADFTTACPYITSAGGIKALDVTAQLHIVPGDESGFLPQDSAVAYRVVWGNTDINGNLILGTPSQRAVVFNPLIDLELMDFNRVLNALDQTSNNVAFPSLISDANYVSTLGLTESSSATNLYTNLISLTQKIDADILYANDTGTGVPLTIASGAISTGVATITFSVGNPQNYLVSGSNIFLAGFTAGTGTINGAQIVSTVTPTTITFNTTATGAVTVTGSSIRSNEYESIPQPSAPSSPATDQQLVDLQTYLQEIITQLQSEPDTGTPPTISANSQTNYISPLQLTTTASVILNITIPEGVTVNDFFQIYRSEIAQATGVQVLATDISPSDELRLVFEGFPTATDISNGFIQVEDNTPAEFAGAFLYTNETTGEGILQANDIPPVALDINRFKNVIFYANTRTRHRLTPFNLLGVQQMIDDYNNGIIPTITISDGVTTNTYTFVTGIRQVIHVNTVADVAGSLAGKYFTFNTVNYQYAPWYKVSGVGTEPSVPGAVLIQVDINTGDSANTVAAKTFAALNVYLSDYSISVLTNQLTITNNLQGSAPSPSAGTSGFVVSVFVAGRGEDAAAHQILLSTNVSPAQAVDETARSFVHVINRNANEIIYAYYLSTEQTVPGQMFLEERTLSANPFYILANDSNTGSSFNPDISPSVFISAISVANPTVVTTSTPHGLINQNRIIITNSNSTPSINGIYAITYISPTQFSIPVNVTIAGTRGALRSLATAVVSDNEVLPNRIYFSKVLEPEAVPIVNTIDVGAKDKAILRIFPLRDSLFVFKEDGLFRISGETAPFNLALFDSSCILLAADSLDVSNNLLYGWTTQGITSTSESGVNIISRPIDIDILKLATEQYTNFKTATWGIGYESDNSYTTYTVQQTNDIVATIGYRYSTLTNTWTTFDKSNTCGVINSADDKQYLGAGDTNFLEKERKDFTRYDYADRELSRQLQIGNYFGNQLLLVGVSEIEVGDVLVQNQLMTIFQFNELLQKLDLDVLLSPHDYLATQEMFAGNDPRDKLDLLINKVAFDAGRLAQPGAFPSSDYTAYESVTGSTTITNISASDPTVITTSTPHGLQTGRIVTINGSNSTPLINGVFAVTVLTPTTFTIPVAVTVIGTTGSIAVENSNFDDIAASYNGLITLLNNDPGVAFNNYMHILNNTSQEAIIINSNVMTNKVTLNNTLDFMVGPLIIFKSIHSSFQYAPQTFSDPNLKKIREAMIRFENKAFTNATLSFSSDLLPAFQDVPVLGTGNGIFGYTGQPTVTQGQSGPIGFGYGFFGGASHSAPFRTLVPRDSQYCTYLNCKFSHLIAREKYSIFGIILTGNNLGENSRGFR